MTVLLKLPDVIERTRLSRGTIYAMIGKGAFPKPLKLSERINAWPEAEVDAWLAGRLADRGARNVR